jgi:hypothetical protein
MQLAMRNRSRIAKIAHSCRTVTPLAVSIPTAKNAKLIGTTFERRSMAAEGTVSLGTLLLGALGAVALLYLKAAVQSAMQRRVIAWQLQGYLLSWRSVFLKHPLFFRAYEKVKERTTALGSAALEGNATLREVHLQQSKELDELRANAKTGITEALTKGELSFSGDDAQTAFMEACRESLADQRRLLADARSFISDHDAAVLGKAAALNAVQFRNSMINFSSTLETLLRVLPVSSEKSSTLSGMLADSLLVYGESALVAMVRMEHIAERASKQNVLELTSDVLIGR